MSANAICKVVVRRAASWMPGSKPGHDKREGCGSPISHLPRNPVCISRRMIATSVLIPRLLGNTVSKPELGTKRLCAGCNAKFYDLNKTEIVCPTCQAVFVVPKPAPVRPRRAFEPLPAVPPVVTTPKSDDAGATLVKADGETEVEAGVPLLEEID